MLKVGGENVDPMETEGLLLEHPAVQQVAVVGLPDERLGEVAVAYVQCRADATIDADDVIGFCRGKIASFKLPRHVVFVDAFPMTESGKIRKADLREEHHRSQYRAREVSRCSAGGHRGRRWPIGRAAAHDWLPTATAPSASQSLPARVIGNAIPPATN